MRRLPALLVVVLAAIALGACGTKEDEVLRGESEASYLDLGELKYQVQISSPLNPDDSEDRSYLVGLSEADRELGEGEEWFAVFVRVQNENDDPDAEPKPVATEFEIRDTQETRFTPLELGDENVFAYRAEAVAPGAVIPVPDSPAGQGSIEGSLLLFKVPTANLENRPLELEIRSPFVPDEVATVTLDV